jgi:hypothetical protein
VPRGQSALCSRRTSVATALMSTGMVVSVLPALMLRARKERKSAP